MHVSNTPIFTFPHLKFLNNFSNLFCIDVGLMVDKQVYQPEYLVDRRLRQVG